MDIDRRRTGTQSFREAHPIATTVGAAGLVTAGSFLLAPAIIVGGLGAVGFSASGVVGGRFSSRFQILRYFYNLFRFYRRWDTIHLLWWADDGTFLCLSVHRGDMGSRIGLDYFWTWVACGWRHYPRLTFTQTQDWWFRVGGLRG